MGAIIALPPITGPAVLSKGMATDYKTFDGLLGELEQALRVHRRRRGEGLTPAAQELLAAAREGDLEELKITYARLHPHLTDRVIPVVNDLIYGTYYWVSPG